MFMGGLFQLCMIEAAPSSFGVGGLLISSSFGVFGVFGVGGSVHDPERSGSGPL